MRIIPVLSALLVMATLYLLVLERDALLDFAGGDRGALGRIGVVQMVMGDSANGTGDSAAPQAPHDAQTTQLAEGPATGQSDGQPAPAPIDTAEPAGERRVSVVALHSEARQIDRAVVLRGRTEAAREVEVRSETSGRMIAEPLPKGTFVEEGQLLCELSPGTRMAALSEAEARLAEAEINFRAAEQLSLEGFASETRAAGARAALQSAQAGVAAASEEISRLKITAPFAGLLESDTAELGALLQPGALCATVILLDPIRLVGFVPETDVDKVEVGALAGARLTSGREVMGRVTFIARSADPATRTFRLEVTVPNGDLTIRDGQTAEIGIEATGIDAHLVPASALTLDDGGRLGLRLVDDESRARFVPVDLVRDTPQGVWVTGLPVTAEVIVVGQEFVIDGVRVDATFREAPHSTDEPATPLGILGDEDAARLLTEREG